MGGVVHLYSMFTRVVHIELLAEISSSSFINALWTFLLSGAHPNNFTLTVLQTTSLATEFKMDVAEQANVQEYFKKVKLPS